MTIASDTINSDFTLRNYGNLQGSPTSWTHSTIENYHNCNLSKIIDLEISGISQFSGTITVIGGKVNMEMYGGEALFSGNVDGIIHHYGGGLAIGKKKVRMGIIPGVGNSVGTLSLNEYSQMTANATLEIDVDNTTSYDTLSAVIFSENSENDFLGFRNFEWYFKVE
jgi:hypothetical protein